MDQATTIPLTTMWPERLGDYIALTKPRLTLLVLLTTAVGAWLGFGASTSFWLLVPTLMGTGLVVGGANAFNQWMERDADALMHRTRTRPLPAGRLSPEAAYRFSLLCTVAGMVLLAVCVNFLSALLAVLAAASYLLWYTPLKRISPLCTLVGAIPGALPPVIGWAAVRGRLDLEAWVLFSLMFFWQLPHFLAIGALYRDDYAKAGFRFLPMLDADGRASARQAVLYGLALVVVSVWPALVGLSGVRYLMAALLVTIGFLLVIVRSALRRSTISARQLFLASILYLPVLMGLLGWGKVASPPALHGRSHPALPQYGMVPPVALVDQEGRPFTTATLRGSVWIADFIFTRCAGQCPLMTAHMANLAAQLAPVAGVSFVSFSVDPTYDTPQRLSAYARTYDATTARWRFVTGNSTVMRRLAQEGFRLGVSEGGPASEPILHSVKFVLIDEQGRIRGYYDAQSPEAMERIPHDVRWLLEHPNDT